MRNLRDHQRTVLRKLVLLSSLVLVIALAAHFSMPTPSDGTHPEAVIYGAAAVMGLATFMAYLTVKRSN
jgi:hypothetical protein